MSINVKDNKANEKISLQNNGNCIPNSVGGDCEVTKKRYAANASLVNETSLLLGYKTNYIYKVLRGDRVNEQVMATYMTLAEGKNKLLQEVEKLIPFDIN